MMNTRPDESVEARRVQLQGYLARKKTPPPRTLQEPYAQGPRVVLWGGALLGGRGTPCRGHNPILDSDSRTS